MSGDENELVAGFSRLGKVLVRCADGSTDGCRAYGIAFNNERVPRAAIVVAATDGEGFVYGRFYLVETQIMGHHDYVVEQVTEVPREGGWKLMEAAVDEKVGRRDPF